MDQAELESLGEALRGCLKDASPNDTDGLCVAVQAFRKWCRENHPDLDVACLTGLYASLMGWDRIVVAIPPMPVGFDPVPLKQEPPAAHLVVDCGY